MKRLNVSYLGRMVGTLAEVPVNGENCIFFEYDPEFVRRDIQLSPLHLDSRPGLLTREGAAPSRQLPGLFEDSIPDRWGKRVMLDWFHRRGILPENVSPLMMLSYVGQRGMGALGYEPETGPAASREIDLDVLYAAASASENNEPVDLGVLADVGSPAGGAQPKALIALPVSGAGSILPGVRDIPGGYEPWIVKFSPRRPGENIGADGRMEEAYARMARAAGIDIPPTRLLSTEHPSGRRHHFAAKRFDRRGAERIHHHTLAAMCQMPGGDMDYETFLSVTLRVTRDEREMLRAFGRAAFNVLAGNQDDHGKNHGFLFRGREWKVSPAYDVTFRKLDERGMAICGERRHASIRHLLQLAERTGLNRREAMTIIDQVRSAISCWPEFAAEAGVPPAFVTEAAATLANLQKAG